MLNEWMPENLQKTIKEKSRKNKLFFMVFCAYILIVWALSYLIPENIFVVSPVIGEFMQWLGGWVPSVEKFGRLSSFPQVSQVLFLLELLSIPFMIILLLRLDQFRKVEFTVVHWFLVILIVPLTFYGYFVHLPINSDGLGLSSRISRTILNSHFSFSLWMTVFTFGVSLLPASIIRNFNK